MTTHYKRIYDCCGREEQCRCPSETKQVTHLPLCDDCVAEVFRGPKIIWNVNDVKRMINKMGLDRTVDRISEGVFERSFVEKQIKMLTETNTDLVSNVSIK